MPIIRPRPRTSPIRACLPARSCRPAMKRSPLRADWPGRSSSSMTSILAEAAAQQIGLPPKVERCSPGFRLSAISGRGDAWPLIGKPSAMPLASDHDVRIDPEVLDREERAAATETGLHLVADEEDAVVVEDLLDPPEVGIGRHDDPALAPDALRDEGRDIAAGLVSRSPTRPCPRSAPRPLPDRRSRTGCGRCRAWEPRRHRACMARRAFCAPCCR